VPDEGLSPFRLEVPQGELDDLYERLDRTRWPDELPDVGWAYGVPRTYLKELVHYWRHGYDWRAAPARLNQWPPVTTTNDRAQHPLPPQPLRGAGRTPAGHPARLAGVDRGVPPDRLPARRSASARRRPCRRIRPSAATHPGVRPVRADTRDRLGVPPGRRRV